MKQLTLPTLHTLPQKLPQARSLSTIGAVTTLPRLPSFNAEAVAEAEKRQALLEQQQAKEANYKQVGGLKDPNDPYVLNSLADAAFNRKAKEKRYGEFAEALHNIPVLGDIITAIPAAIDVALVQPVANIFKGDFKALGINTLTGFSETMDILANPVKSLITPLVNQDTADKKYQLPWYERLASGFGFSDEGRYNYDYDTGFWLADFGLEIISDPLNVVELIVAMYTGGSNIAAKQGAKATAKQVGKEVVGEFTEKVAKELGEEISEEALSKLATKKIAKQMIEDTTKLRKLGVKISSATKAIAKTKTDNGLKILAQNLDTALSKSKGIVDSNVKSIVNSIADTVKQYDDIPKAILKDFDDFTTASKYTLKDIFGDSLGGVLNKNAYKKTTEINKQIAEAAAKGDNALIAQLKENLKLVLSDPASIKKYKNGIEISTDAIELLSQVELTDYMNSLNSFVVDYNNFKLFNALDKMSSVTEAADKGILVAALMSSPVTQAVYFTAKSGAFKKLGGHVTRFMIKTLTDITDWVSAKTVIQVLYETDTVLASTRAALQKFNIFSGEEIFKLDFGKEYAQNVYNKTIDWARGFGRADQYAPTEKLNKVTGSVEEVQVPVNILILSPEERRRHYMYNFTGGYNDNLTDEELDELFFRRLNEVGHYGATGERLQEWDLASYVKSIQPDDATIRLQQLYTDFTQTFTKSDSALNSPQAFLKFVADLDTPTARTTLTSVQDSLLNYTPEFSKEVISNTLKTDFETAKFRLKPDVQNAVSEGLIQVHAIAEELQTAYNSLDLLTEAGEEYLVVKTQIEVIKDLQFKLRSRISQFKTDMKKVPKDVIKQTKFFEQYRQFGKILSPYFGQKETIVENSKVFYELRGNARNVTHKILESKEFQELVTAFRAGNDGAKLLEANITEAKVVKASEAVSYDLSDIDASVSKILDNYDLSEGVTAESIKEELKAYSEYLQEVNATYKTAQENYVKYYKLLEEHKDNPEVLQKMRRELSKGFPSESPLHRIAKYAESYRDIDRIRSPFAYYSKYYFQNVVDWMQRQGIYTGLDSVDDILNFRTELRHIFETHAALFQAFDDIRYDKPLGDMLDYRGAYLGGMYKDTKADPIKSLLDGGFISPKNKSVQEGSDVAVTTSENAVEQTELEIKKIQNFLKSVDNYVELVSIVKQSQVPEVMQDIFFDTLQNFEVKDAQRFSRNFNSNLTKFVQQMNIGLAGRYQTHHFTLDYYATKLLSDKEHAAKATKYLQSNRTALDNAEFMEVLFKSQLLPEVSKTRKVIINGQEIEEFVNEFWNSRQNRTFVYLDFETSGFNSTLDQVQDFGLYCPDMKERWAYTASEIDSTMTEVNALLSFYNKLKAMSEANTDKEFLFIFQNKENLDISFLNQRFKEAIETSYTAQDFELSDKLIAARDWLVANLSARSMNNIDLLKQVEGIPTVGKYYNDIKRFLDVASRSQSQANSTMMLYLNEDIFNLIEKFPVLDPTAYKEIKDAMLEILHTCNDAKYLWSARMGVTALDGTFLIDGDIYKPSKNYLFKDDTASADFLQSNEIYIPDRTELIELKDNRWYFKNQALPEDITDANAAVKYLKTQGLEYAPSWRALNLKQQLSTYPVLINGNISLQTIEGIESVAFRRYVDTDLIKDFFDITELPYQAQHALTNLAQEMSDVVAKIKNTSIIEQYSEFISRYYAIIIEYSKTDPVQILYRFLKEDTDIYHKFAVLTVIIKDDSASPAKAKLKALLKEKEIMPAKITFEDLYAVGYQEPVQPSKWNIKEAGTLRYPKKVYSEIPDYPKWDNDAIGFKSYPNKMDFETHGEYLEEFYKIKAYNDAAFAKYRTDFDKQVYDWKLNKIRTKSEDAIKYSEIIREINEHNAKAIERYKTLKNSEWEAYKNAWAELYENQKILQDFENEQAALKNSTEFVTQNEARDAFAQLIYAPYPAYQEPKFQQLFSDYDAVSRLNYHSGAYSRSEFLEHIYDSEQKGMTYAARDLQKAFEQDSSGILDATESLKRGLDENKVYAPVMQRHAAIGQSHIALNDTYIKIVNSLRDGLELDTFLACDKQIVNNLEDLLVKQVCNLSPKDLTSFVYHQGKGVVVIPVGSYLSDTSPHSFDLKDILTAFAERYKNYEDEFIKVIRSDGDLIVYAKDYQAHIKQELVPYKPLEEVDYDLAFKSAFGYPQGTDSWKDFEASVVHFEHSTSEANFETALERFIKNRKTVINSGISSKRLQFLLTHFEEIEELRTAHLKHHQTLTRLAIDFDDQYSFMLGGYGRVMDSSQVNELFESLPKEVRETVFNGELPEKEFYNTSEHMFNFSTLGRAAYRKKYEHFATSNYQSLLAQTYRSLNNNLSSVAQYAAFYYNASEELEHFIPYANHLVGVPIPDPYRSPVVQGVPQATTPWGLNSIFGDMPDEQVYNVLKGRDEFTISYLGVDKNSKPRVEVIAINSPEDVQFARNKGAILLPSTTAGSVIQTMNNKRWANSKFKLFHKINYFLKACMLIHPGFVFRNFIDSTLKNFLVSKDPGSMVNSYYDALTYYTRYKETVNMLFALNPDSPFRPDTMKIVFEDSTAPLSEELFMLVHNFIESGPSAGSIDKVSKFYLKKAAKPSLINQIYDTLLQPTKGLEQITRLAEYLEFIKKGMTNTDAFQLITKTHFDYAAKTGTTRLIEFIIPFYSFQAKNFEFWLDFLNKSPVLAYILTDYFQSVWNWEKIDFSRINAYQSQLNHIMQANIQLNKQGLTLKVNPSFMDPINILANPIDSFTSRVSPIFKPIADAIQGQEPYNYEQLVGTVTVAAASIIPGVGGAIGGATAIASQYANRLESGYRSYQRTGSSLPLIAPSIFGSVKTPAQYGRASYTNSRAFMDPQKRVPRRVSTYNKLYTDTGKNRWQLRYLPVDNFTVQWRIRESTNRFR